MAVSGNLTSGLIELRRAGQRLSGLGAGDYLATSAPITLFQSPATGFHLFRA